MSQVATLKPPSTSWRAAITASETTSTMGSMNRGS
jgi:hypothetical protein